MTQYVLLLNAGSSSLKFSCHELLSGKLRAHGQAEWAGEQARFRFVFLGGEVNTHRTGRLSSGAVRRRPGK